MTPLKSTAPRACVRFERAVDADVIPAGKGEELFELQGAGQGGARLGAEQQKDRDVGLSELVASSVQKLAHRRV